MVKKGIDFDSFTCNILVKGFCDMGLLPKARWVMEMLCHNGEAISTDIVGFNTIIHGYFKACEVSDGLEITKSMIQAGVLPDIVTYNILINGFCEMGDFDIAKSLMDEHLESCKNVNVCYNISLPHDRYGREYDNERNCKRRGEGDVAAEAAVVSGSVGRWRREVPKLLWLPVELPSEREELTSLLRSKPLSGGGVTG
nr:pentatricopeptide repeat-containing protein At5g14770, mitochondrial [Ipomoea batatas]